MGNQKSTEHITAKTKQNIDGSTCKSHPSVDDSKQDNTNMITIVHISDTHCNHNQIVLPKGDILISTGDFCTDGTKNEYMRFNDFLGKHRSNFPLGIFVVLGNHDYKFLDGTGHSESLIHTMADDKLRKTYFSELLSNAQVIDNEAVTIKVLNHTLSIFGVPWTPFQSKPTYPEKMPKIGSGHSRVLQQWKKNNIHKQIENTEYVTNFYDHIPDNLDILLSHIPPFGVFDQMPVVSHWGSSLPFLQTILKKNIRCLLFGHVHAQRGYWEKVNNEKGCEIIGGCQYAKSTHDTRTNGIVYDLMDKVQFIANSALMSDRTVQPFAKKKIVGKPRVIKAFVLDGQWMFHNV